MGGGWRIAEYKVGDYYMEYRTYGSEDGVRNTKGGATREHQNTPACMPCAAQDSRTRVDRCREHIDKNSDKT
jgi:hypothetical protein